MSATPSSEKTGDPLVASRGVLQLVATPIGNLEDVTLRALRVLAEADLVFAEDTRRTRTLLDRHGIAARPVSLHAHNEMLTSVAFLPDGETILSAARDGTIKVWHLSARETAEIGSCRATLYGFSPPVTALGIAPDGETVVAGAGGAVVVLSAAKQ